VIERFNFYDVYGYLLPGLALLGLAWLPFAILRHKWPENELLSAVVVLAIGYVLGHVLQSVATAAFPSTFSDAKGQQRYPSDLLLDETDKQFSQDTKKRIREKTQQQFSIDVAKGTDGDNNLSLSRREAFLMARQVLIRDEVAGYTEQFEGLYAMMRGLAVASLLGAAYLSFWALAIHKSQSWWLTAIVLLGVSFATICVTGLLRMCRSLQDAKRHAIDKITFVGLATGAASTAYLMGFSRVVDPTYSELYGLFAIICLTLAQRFWVGYKAFAFEFASSVWRYFAFHTEK
jgi:hypothetical protein